MFTAASVIATGKIVVRLSRKVRAIAGNDVLHSVVSLDSSRIGIALSI
jgi:hypothetical protein